jgi:hypothetical protein
MTRKILFYLIMFGLMLSVLEAFAYVSRYIFDDIYDHRGTVLPKLQDDVRNERELGKLDPATGWDYRGPLVARDCNCQGTEVTYSFDQNGARVYGGYNGDLATVVLVGDSYTHGSEVAADDTYAAQLSKLLDTPVANLGVGGFGPVQAFLNLKRKLSLYPKTRVVILGIMYENIFRMVNSYRPVLADKSEPYRIKPYIAQGEIRQLDPDVLESIDAFRHYANAAFDQDFWAKPRHRFPFIQAFARALTSNYVYHKRLPHKLRKIGMPEYYLAYRATSFTRELVRLLVQFTEFARQQHVKPVVVFIPRDKYDTQSVSQFIRLNNDQLPDDLQLIDVGAADIDWMRYNLTESKDPDNISICHPSPYGHEKIAIAISRTLQEGH